MLAKQFRNSSVPSKMRDTLAALQTLVSAGASHLSVDTLEAGIQLADAMVTQWRAEIVARADAATDTAASGALEPSEAPASGAAPALATRTVAECGPVYMSLANRLYGGLEAVSTRSAALGSLPAEDHLASFTNVPGRFLDGLMQKLRPAFLIEVGSWKGGSALRIADAAVAATPTGSPLPCLLCSKFCTLKP